MFSFFFQSFIFCRNLSREFHVSGNSDGCNLLVNDYHYHCHIHTTAISLTFLQCNLHGNDFQVLTETRSRSQTGAMASKSGAVQSKIVGGAKMVKNKHHHLKVSNADDRLFLHGSFLQPIYYTLKNLSLHTDSSWKKCPPCESEVITDWFFMECFLSFCISSSF